MKAISLWQPWATLIAVGAKRYETRSWYTSYRGPLLICAAKAWNAECKAAMEDKYIRDALQGCNLPFGVAVCLVDLVACAKTYRKIYMGQLVRTYAGEDEIFPVDEPFGDFYPGRFAWKLENIRKVRPFAVKGMQGLFEVATPEEDPFP